MKNSTYLIITTIGALSLVSAIYLAATGADFSTYFFGGFIGFTLIGTAYIGRNKNKSE